MTSETGINTYSFYWMFTINNPSRCDLPAAWKDVQYAVWQSEKGEESGTLHLQGYVCFTNKKQRTWVKKNCDQRANWQSRKGSHEQACAYVTKEQTRVDGPWELGAELDEWVNKQRGKRNDLLALKRKLDAGETEAQIAASEDGFPTWIKYHRCITRYNMLRRQNERNWVTFTQVYWGPPGTGKTRRALAEAGPGAYWLAKPTNQSLWFDGYDGQEVVVIDEFYGWIARDLMQRMCDRYPLLVQTKGGTTPFLPKKIIITSNEHPAAWWSKVGLGPMLRRLEGTYGKIEEMVGMWTPDPAAPAPPRAETPEPERPTARRRLFADEELTPSPCMGGIDSLGADTPMPSPHQGDDEEARFEAEAAAWDAHLDRFGDL